MKNKIFFSFLIGIFWFFLFVFFEIFLKIVKLFFFQKFSNFLFISIFNILQIFPIFFAIFFSSYFFLKTKNKILAFFVGFFVNIFFLFLMIFVFPEYFFYGIASAPPKNVAIFQSPLIFLENFIFLLLHQNFICKYEKKNIKKIFFKIGKILFFYYFFWFLYFFFNSIIIFFATTTGAPKFCDFNLRYLPPPIQNGQKSFLYPETCLLEMAKNGFFVCEKMDDHFYKNACFLEMSLQKNDKKICEKISDSPAGFYLDCIFGEKNSDFATKCMFPNFREKNFGENISFKNCVKKKFLEFSENKKSRKNFEK